jgi:hypothetical protein
MSDQQKQNDVYEVKISGDYSAYVEAASIPKARAIALRRVSVRKLSGSEVARIVAAGGLIDDGSDDSQAELQLGGEA